MTIMILHVALVETLVMIGLRVPRLSLGVRKVTLDDFSLTFMFSGGSNHVDGTARAAIAGATRQLEPRLCIFVPCSPWMRSSAYLLLPLLSNKDERPGGAWAGTNVKTMQSDFLPTASKRATLPQTIMSRRLSSASGRRSA
jgi:hypothetical protein